MSENSSSNPQEVVDNKNFDNITCHNGFEDFESKMTLKIYNILQGKIEGGGYNYYAIRT